MVNLFPDEKEEFEKVFIEHNNALYNFALKLTRASTAAEDLVQETFLRAFRFFSKFKKGTNIKAWLFRIMHNLFINNYRKKKREPETSELKEEILAEQEVREDFLSDILSEEVQQALDSLLEEFREAVILSDLEGFSYLEIGEILGCPPGTVRSRLARGRALLYRKLYDYAKARGYIN